MSKIDKHQVSWKQFEEDVRILASMIKEHAKNTPKFRHIYGIPRGGLVIAVRLSHLLKIPLIEEVTEDGSTLIVDDVSDTGKTLLGWDQFGTATLYRKDITCTEPDFCVRTVNAHIVFPWEQI